MSVNIYGQLLQKETSLTAASTLTILSSVLLQTLMFPIVVYFSIDQYWDGSGDY